VIAERAFSAAGQVAGHVISTRSSGDERGRAASCGSCSRITGHRARAIPDAAG
jgi:hypothetical protein